MNMTQEEQYGKLALTNILSSVWLGDWDRYEEIFRHMDEELKENFPFHAEYSREEVNLWHDNHFFIPGDYFVSPYFSSYTSNNGDVEERKKNLLCLIGTFEKIGFYFPLQQELYPDHMGCLTACIGALQREKIEATKNEDSELIGQLVKLEEGIALNYILPVLEAMKKSASKKIHHPFFGQFLPFFYDVMKVEYTQH